ncbi:MAG: thermostable hemolysin [Gammaproteobacteria bacterium]|nr:thermostable hemolysin [Gammaproteobacteria bacterium]MCP5136184.1 thermostable hemolysin [Gammaproteobacteria bacterium]
MHENATRTPRRIVPTLVDMNAGKGQNRHQVEAFIHDHFAQIHGADVRKYLPALMSLRSDDGNLLGALGLRAAAGETLYLEHYLDRPIEQVLAGAVGTSVSRDGVIEVGNLAVGAPGGGRWLITALTAFLHAADQQWAVFTCGPRLRNAFTRLGIDLADLGPARPDRLPDGEASLWGNYYDQGPHVMAARVVQSHAVLATLFERECALTALWQHANEAGQHAGYGARAA